MKRRILMCALLPALMVFQGCTADDDTEDTSNPWDDTDSETGTGMGDANYTCFPDAEVDTEECGPYPDNDGVWDMLAVVPNVSFKAYYDRDCDGVVEETMMRMYEDVYCKRDTVKSLVLAVGSNCGSSGDGS